MSKELEKNSQPGKAQDAAIGVDLSVRLPGRVELEFTDRQTLNNMATEYHYMHRPVHQRSCPFGYQVRFDDSIFMPDGKPCGFIIFASIHFVRQRCLFGYAGLPTKWQVLSLARMWLHDDLPRNTATTVLGKVLRVQGHERISQVGHDWLKVHPPKYPEQPYHVRLINSYADKTHGHEGIIYQAANFERIGEVKSQRRHKNTRGPGFDDHTLIQYVYRLPEPRMTINDVKGAQLHIFAA
ncbi:MAG: hypothetical protein HUU32_04705 [Calditrichaceae bacterium]|nr:hypothetical protein [Calditrichia bacterium]NUQ40674.1 hypothetical protein [Calditrichaceae bacterium]